ncbi:MAG: TlpA disulfide reductase family protein [Ignavibacteriota bacterium]
MSIWRRCRPIPCSTPRRRCWNCMTRSCREAGFSLVALDGKTYNLDALRGKVVLLNFWATWCPPCRREMPDMEKLYQRFASKGLVVLAVLRRKARDGRGLPEEAELYVPRAARPGSQSEYRFRHVRNSEQAFSSTAMANW